MLLGAVDLGSNSFRVEIGRLARRQYSHTKLLEGNRSPCRWVRRQGALTPEIQARALAAACSLQ